MEIKNIKESLKEDCILTAIGNRDAKIGVLSLVLDKVKEIDFNLIKKVWYFDYTDFINQKVYLKFDDFIIMYIAKSK